MGISHAPQLGGICLFIAQKHEYSRTPRKVGQITRETGTLRIHDRREPADGRDVRRARPSRKMTNSLRLLGFLGFQMKDLPKEMGGSGETLPE